MAPEQGHNHAMADAADLIEAKHQLIHDLQRRLQRELPELAARWETREFNTFQQHYCQFDTEIERVKQGLDMVHASLTGQELGPVPAARSRRKPGQQKDRRDSAPEGTRRLAAAHAELSALLGALSHELADSMGQWNEASRAAWNAAQSAWAESSSRQRDIVGAPSVPNPCTSDSSH